MYFPLTECHAKMTAAVLLCLVEEYEIGGSMIQKHLNRPP